MAQVTIRTNFTPPFTFDPTDKPQGSSALMKLIQPSVSGDFPIIGDVHFEPYGKPNEWGLVVLYAVVILALYGLYKIIH